MTTNKLPLVIAYGGGINSTAMLCGFRERDIKPDLILFADTKGEFERTYRHKDEMSALCQLWWGIEIQTVQKLYEGEHEGLEAECRRKNILPSLAYGNKACSVKHKIEPQTKALKAWMDANKIKSVTRAVGYHAGEGHRAVGIQSEDLKKGRTAHNWFPLIEWQWRQADCLEAIKRHGLTPPGKSACFFCPASKRHEIIALKHDRPDLYERAIAMERNLSRGPRSVKRAVGVDDQGGTVYGQALEMPRVLGLAMGVSWEEITAADENQAKLFDWVDEHAATTIPCGCFDV